MITTRRVDPSWWVIAVATLIVGLVAVASLRQTTQSVPLDAGSAEPSGALALSILLHEFGHPVSTASTSGPDFETLSSNTTVMLVQTGMDLSSADADAAATFVHRGGTLVITTDGSYNRQALRRFGITASPLAGARLKVSQPVLRAPIVVHIHGSAAAALYGANSTVPVIRSEGNVVLTVTQIGSGKVWVLGAPSLLENQSIALEDNGKLAVNLVGPAHTPVVFDQYLPRTSGLPTNWLAHTTWGVALLFLLAVALLYRWLAGRRLGPPVIPLSDHHRAASEYVVSMAGLLRRARSRSEILGVYQNRLARLRERECTMTPDQRTVLDRIMQPVSHISEAELVALTSTIVQLEDELVRAGP